MFAGGGGVRRFEKAQTGDHQTAWLPQSSADDNLSL
jgi:hypothetical protein